MVDLGICKESTEKGGRFLTAIKEAADQAELTWRVIRPGVILADHTGVPEAMEGRGIGSALVRHLIDDARTNGYKIIPQCPFIRAKFEQHPEWADLLAQ